MRSYLGFDEKPVQVVGASGPRGGGSNRAFIWGLDTGMIRVHGLPPKSASLRSAPSLAEMLRGAAQSNLLFAGLVAAGMLLAFRFGKQQR